MTDAEKRFLDHLPATLDDILIGRTVTARCGQHFVGGKCCTGSLMMSHTVARALLDRLRAAETVARLSGVSG